MGGWGGSTAGFMGLLQDQQLWKAVIPITSSQKSKTMVPCWLLCLPPAFIFCRSKHDCLVSHLPLRTAPWDCLPSSHLLSHWRITCSANLLQPLAYSPSLMHSGVVRIAEWLWLKWLKLSVERIACGYLSNRATELHVDVSGTESAMDCWVQCILLLALSRFEAPSLEYTSGTYYFLLEFT